MTSVKVLETNVVHASDVVYWLDGSSAETPEEMLRIQKPLALQITKGPQDLGSVNGVGKTAFFRRPTKMVAGIATEADKSLPEKKTFVVAGVVSDPAGLYIPRRFQIDAGNGTGHGLELYPSPLGARFGPAGGLQGTLRYSTSDNPVAWALLTLTVTTALGTELIFRCQATGQGDFIMPLQHLPPLREGIEHYAATLSIAALTSATASSPVDPSKLVAMNLLSLDGDLFANPIALSVIPGEIRLLRSYNRPHLIAKP